MPIRPHDIQPSRLAPPDQQRLQDAIEDRSESRAHLARQWVRELGRTAEQVARDGSDSAVDTRSVFWIRLYDTLATLGEHYAFAAELGSRLAVSVRDAIAAAAGSLTDDERLYLHYRRDVECHVWQTYYELRSDSANKKLVEYRQFALLCGQRIHVDEFDRRASALLRTYHCDETRIAVAFARRLLPFIEGILNAMRPLYND